MEACPRLTADPPSAPLAPPETGLLGGGGYMEGEGDRKREGGEVRKEELGRGNNITTW